MRLIRMFFKHGSQDELRSLGLALEQKLCRTKTRLRVVRLEFNGRLVQRQGLRLESCQLSDLPGALVKTAAVSHEWQGLLIPAIGIPELLPRGIDQPHIPQFDATPQFEPPHHLIPPAIGRSLLDDLGQDGSRPAFISGGQIGLGSLEGVANRLPAERRSLLLSGVLTTTAQATTGHTSEHQAGHGYDTEHVYAHHYSRTSQIIRSRGH